MEQEKCARFRFGLLVTGITEKEHLPKLFQGIAPNHICSFVVIDDPIFTEENPVLGQRNPRGEKRKAKMVGRGDDIPKKDLEEIGFPARRYLTANPCHFVLLIDDLEHNRQRQAQEVFNRYRQAFDAALKEEQQRRASVHFLVNMLEAYYFADAKALNATLAIAPLQADYDGDVEMIRNPKGYLRGLLPSFNEIVDGGKVLSLINVEHILSNPDTCAGLRTLFAWCVKVIKLNPDYQDLIPPERYCLNGGVLSDLTKAQLDNF